MEKDDFNVVDFFINCIKVVSAVIAFVALTSCEKPNNNVIIENIQQNVISTIPITRTFNFSEVPNEFIETIRLISIDNKYSYTLKFNKETGELLNKISIVAGEYYYTGCNSTTIYHWQPQQHITYRVKDVKDQWGFYKDQRFFPIVTIVPNKTNYSLDIEYDCFIIAVEKTKASGLKYSLDTDEKYSGSESRYSCLETEKYYYFIVSQYENSCEWGLSCTTLSNESYQKTHFTIKEPCIGNCYILNPQLSSNNSFTINNLSEWIINNVN